jgi:hypothetical protein
MRGRRTQPTRPIPTGFRRRESVLGLAVVSLVTVAAVALTVQGWRGRIPAFDLVTYVHSVRDLLATGAVPEHGDTGSYGSLKPPGTAWLMVPSSVLFDDPRLSEYAGTAGLHLTALLGLFLLSRKYFGTWCACLAVVLYGLSETGLFLAGSLWPNGRPEFFVWIVYLASEWVTRRDPRFLAAAGAVWGLAMHVDMGITPAILVLPALWLLYRPPLRIRPLLVAAGVVLTVWMPYLSFEAPRGFADVRSQLLFQPILPSNYADSWCNPNASLRRLADAGGSQAASSAQTSGVDGASYPGRPLVGRADEAVDKLISNFRPLANVPGRLALSVVLMLIVVASMLLSSISGASGGGERPAGARRFRDLPLVRPTISAVIGGLVVHGLTRLPGVDGALPAYAVSALQRLATLVALGGIAVLAGVCAVSVANRVLARRGVHLQSGEVAAQKRLLAVSLAVPWLTLVALAEPGKPERFWWIWPLQVLFLAAFATDVLPRLGAARPVAWLVQAVLLVLVIGNGLLLNRADAWLADGWSGRDADEVQVVDYVADRVASEGDGQAAIGYQIFIYPFMANSNITNPQYKVGAEFDLLLKYRRGIANGDTCAEGVSPSDEYRIVRTRPMSEDWAPRHYFDVPLDDRFRLLRELGPYQVFTRNP